MNKEVGKKSVVKKILIIALMIILFFVYAVFTIRIMPVIKGRNYSDVGVPMYENSTLAFISGIFFYLIMSFLTVFLIDRFLDGRSKFFFWTGVPVIITIFLMFSFVMLFAAFF